MEGASLRRAGSGHTAFPRLSLSSTLYHGHSSVGACLVKCGQCDEIYFRVNSFSSVIPWSITIYYQTTARHVITLMLNCYNRSKCICVNLFSKQTAQGPRYSHSIPRAGPGCGDGLWTRPDKTAYNQLSPCRHSPDYACQEKQKTRSMLCPLSPTLIISIYLLTCVGGGNVLVKIKDAFFSFYCQILVCWHAVSVCTSHKNVFSILILLINWQKLSGHFSHGSNRDVTVLGRQNLFGDK